MRVFQVFLGMILMAIIGYTFVVGSNHGWNLLPIFFGDIAKMNWPGQFNFDFMGFLLLSGLWVSWRHQFSAVGMVLGVVAVFGGVMFLSAYLLVQTFSVNGDVKALLLGQSRAHL